MRALIPSLLGVLLIATTTARTAVAETAAVPANEKQFGEAMAKYLSTDDGKQAVFNAVRDFSVKMQQEEMKKRQDQQKADFEEQFKNPVKIDVGGSPVKGPANAKITIIEFSDFQCPYCKRAKETMDELMKAYPNDIKLAFKNMPLPFHKEATPAAKAALAAGKQGKFWEMHDVLFTNQEKLGAAFYVEQAKLLGLDVAKFQKDMADPAFDVSIKADQDLAAAHSIQGTPGFFVGGVAVRGAYPLDHFKMIVDRLLGAQAAPAK